MPDYLSYVKRKKKRIIQVYGTDCFYCGKDLSKRGLTVDHFTPKCIGGSDEIDNLRPACKKCNSTKGTKSIEELRFYLRIRKKGLPKWVTPKIYRCLLEDYGFDFGGLPEHKFHYEKVSK